METLKKFFEENKMVVVALIIIVVLAVYWYYNKNNETTSESAVALPQMNPEGFQVVSGGVTLPYGLYNNTVVYCPQSGLLYKIVNNTKRRYPLGLYKKNAANGLEPPYQTVDCQLLNQVTDGGVMN